MKIAVMCVHGIGRPEPDFSDGLKSALLREFMNRTGADGLVFRPAYWAPALQNSENELWDRLSRGGPMDFLKLRRFMVDFASDAIAYQPIPRERDAYESVHQVLASTLRQLAEEAGPTAPLVIISHSLGTVISSNFIYDLQAPASRRAVPSSVRKKMGSTPLDRGETLSYLFTLGSPLALWSLRYKDFGKPIQVPAPALGKHHPNVRGGWLNFYDQDDVIGYPLRSLNTAYANAVQQDIPINVGGWLSSWNPTSHTAYWTDRDVVLPIADRLASLAGEV